MIIQHICPHSPLTQRYLALLPSKLTVLGNAATQQQLPKQVDGQALPLCSREKSNRKMATGHLGKRQQKA